MSIILVMHFSFLKALEYKSCEFKIDFSLLLFNMDISLYIYIFKMTLSPSVPKILPKGRLSQIFYLGPIFFFSISVF